MPPPADPLPAPPLVPPKPPRPAPPLAPPRIASPTVPPLDLAAFRLSRPQLLCRWTSLPLPIPSKTWPERLCSFVERRIEPSWAWRPVDGWDTAASCLPEVLPVRPVTESGLPALLAMLSGLPDRPTRESDLPVLPVTRSALPAVPDAPPVPPALAPRSIQFPSYPRKFRLLSTAARFACWPNRSRVAWSR